MSPERRGLFPPFAGVALADILANSVAIVIIMIVVTLMARYEQEQDKLEQTEDVAVLLSRELASSFVMNALPTSPPARLHDYVASPLDRNPYHSTMPIVELHRDFVRDYYTGVTYRREELLRQDNAFDGYLAGLAPEQLQATRVDIYSIRQFYIVMSIFKAHGLQPRHWHFLAHPAAGGRESGEVGGALALVDRTRGDRPGESLNGEGAVPGQRGGSGPEAALPEDVSLATTTRGFDAYPNDSALAGGDFADFQEYFELPGGSGERGLQQGGAAMGAGDIPPGGVPSDSAGTDSGNRFRAAGRVRAPLTIAADMNLDTRTMLRGLFAYMKTVQAAADANLPSPLPHYDFRRDVLGIVSSLPAPDFDEDRLLRSLVFLMETPRQPDDEALRISPLTTTTMRGQALAVFANEPLHRALWLHDSAQSPPAAMATVTLRLGAHAEIHEGLRMPLAQDGILLMPLSETAADPRPHWRVVTLVNPQRNDFVTGFLYAAVDDVGRLLLSVDENAVDANGVRVESYFPVIAFRDEFRQLLFYGLIAALFTAGIVGRYWRRA